jgi:hypothetical protein
MNTQGGRTLVIGGRGFLWTFVGPGLADSYPPRHHHRLAREAFEAVELRSTSWVGGDTAWSEFNHASTRWLIFSSLCLFQSGRTKAGRQNRGKSPLRPMSFQCRIEV